MRIDTEAYLIQGFFFQQRQFLGLSMKPIDGAVAVVREGLFRDMFAGMIWREGCLGVWTGSLIDPVGDSKISKIRLTPNSFSFTKKYDGHPDTIHYEFEWETDHWAGGFRGEHVGTGSAVCALTPTPEGILTRLDHQK